MSKQSSDTFRECAKCRAPFASWPDMHFQGKVYCQDCLALAKRRPRKAAGDKPGKWDGMTNTRSLTRKPTGGRAFKPD